MSTLVGTTIGGYRLVEEIGKGGMAIVYKAYQAKLNRWVAVKVLDPLFSLDKTETVTRFRREARAIASLRHPNILSIFDYGEQKGLEYFVTEYIENGSLRDALQHGPLASGLAISLTMGVGEALALAHSHDVVHRDVKPANILLAKEDWPLLADFGLAKLLQERQRLTDPGTTLGTPEYTSPEQALGERIDHRTDIYSLGIVLFEAVNGAPPFQSSKPFDVLLMHLNQQPPKLSGEAGVTEDLNRVVHRALAKNPEDRYPQMTDMLADLVDISHHTESTGVTDTGRRQSCQNVGIGLSGPCFLVPGTIEPIPIPSARNVLVGRTDPRQHVTVDIDLSKLCQSAVGISRRHARLIHEDCGWQIEDLRSTNGTYLNGHSLAPARPTPLKDGDSVRLGHLELIFRAG